MRWYNVCSAIVKRPFHVYTLRKPRNNSTSSPCPWSNTVKFLGTSAVRFSSNDGETSTEPGVQLVSQRRLKRLKQQAESERVTTAYRESIQQLSEEATRTVEPNSLGADDVDFPSDRQTWENNSRRLQSRLSVRPRVDPSSTSVLLFPGQGSQFVGMGAGLLAYPRVMDMYKMANEVLGFDLLNLCLHGPKSQLDKTVYCQLAIFVTSLAAVEKLRDTHPNLIENCVATAGFSVGEYAALVFAGALSLEDALMVLKARAGAMQLASEEVASGMMSVVTGRESKLGFGMLAAKEHCRVNHGIANPVCSIANYLCPEVKVIAGHKPALDFVKTNAKQLRLRRLKELPVSGAFHTSLMDAAVEPVSKALKRANVERPHIPVHNNVTGAPYGSAKAIHKLLQKQIVKPVKWEQTMHIVYSRPKGESFPRTVEFGPGKQLGVILKQVNSVAFQEYLNVSVQTAEEDYREKAAPV